MGIDIADSFAEFNRQAKQAIRVKIFLEDNARAVQHTVAFALLGLLLWGADWAMDAEYAQKALFFRLGMAALLLLSAGLKWVAKSVFSNYLVNYLALALGEVALLLLLAGLKEGTVAAGAGQFLYFLLGSVVLGGLYPFNLNLLGCVVLMAIPSIVGALLVRGFPHLIYASILWPAGILAILGHWKIRLAQVENARLRHEVEDLALVDQATGLLNMRGFEQAFQRLVRLGAFKPLQQFLLLIEIDGFGRIVAAHGPAFAQSLRGQIGQTIDLSFRGRDITASTHEEFVCLLQHVSRERAFDIAERFRNTVADKAFNCATMEGGALKCTVSIGIVSAEANDHVKTLLNLARVGASQARTSGGNQCVCV